MLNSGFITKLDWRQNRVIKTYDLESRSGLQAIAYDQIGRRVFAAGTMHKKYGEPRKVRLWTADETSVQTWGEPAGSHIAGALAIAAERNAQGERIAVLPLIFDNAVAVFDVERGRLLGKIKTAIALDETNPPARALRGAVRRAALASARMRFDVPDAAPSDELNRILWHDAKGWHVPYPKARQAVFAPMAVNLDDDHRERMSPRDERRRDR